MTANTFCLAALRNEMVFRYSFGEVKLEGRGEDPEAVGALAFLCERILEQRSCSAEWL